MVWEIVSKAAERSRRIRILMWPESTAMRRSLVILMRAVSVIWRALPSPHLGRSIHLSVMLVPAYKPLLKRSRPRKKQTWTWPEGAESALQDWFMHTYWEVFMTAASQGDQIEIEGYAKLVTSYITKCTEDVTVIKTFTALGNCKPWMTIEVVLLQTARDAAFRAGDITALCSARSALSKGIKATKGTYAEKIQGPLCDTGNTRQMWQGVQALTDYKSRQEGNDNDASLPHRLNNLFAHFEVPNPTTRGKSVPSPPSIGPALTINAADTRWTLTRFNPQ